MTSYQKHKIYLLTVGFSNIKKKSLKFFGCYFNDFFSILSISNLHFWCLTTPSIVNMHLKNKNSSSLYVLMAIVMNMSNTTHFTVKTHIYY